MMLQTGVPCQCGSGRIVVVKSQKTTDSRIQYLGCRKCGYRPEQNKRVLRVDERSPEMAKC